MQEQKQVTHENLNLKNLRQFYNNKALFFKTRLKFTDAYAENKVGDTMYFCIKHDPEKFA